MPKPTARPMKPAGSRAAPSMKAAPMAQQRSHGQQGAAMKAMHAAPKATTPVIRPPSRGAKRK